MYLVLLYLVSTNYVDSYELRFYEVNFEDFYLFEVIVGVY